MRPGIKLNEDKYWEYVLCYVDDILAISHEPSAIMKDLQEHYTLKEGSVKEPDQYLGAQVCKWRIDDVDDLTKTHWAMSSDGYVKQAIAKVECNSNKLIDT